MESPHLRLLCVDDHAVVREGIAAVVNKHPDLKVIAFAANAREAISEYLCLRPDIVLMDLQLPGISGFEAIRAIRREDPLACVIVLTMFTGDVDVHRALQAGAAAYLLKDTLSDDLVRTIREVYAKRGADTSTTWQASRVSTPPLLSAREEDVLRLLAAGMRNKEIAAQLGISAATVGAHVKHIFAKLRVHDRTGAMAEAIRLGILHMD